MTEEEIKALVAKEAREYARSTEFRAAMLDAQRTLFRPPRLRTAAEFKKFAETATDQTVVELANGQSGWWTFVYDASITDAYKWVFMGGPPMKNTRTGGDTTNSVYSAFVTLNGPSLTAPFNGIYDILLTLDSYSDQANTVALAAIFANGVNLGGAATSSASNLVSVAGAGSHRAGSAPGATLAVGHVVDVRYCSAFGATPNVSFRDRHLYMTPTRIGP